ncbi:hypothetical protein E4T52_14008 [Aureobasidium sp. EXF-3400]|jgi:predicted  nucleic acid-binding Zn-ribbon protein|nr:hypothetical protein E4T51_13152 [Aureobasidium sp. EXF-12344]KAI4770985.1 hypothetical protein E4T52_14008 [Aureobasidium sp. EXF-3400]
MSGSTLAVLRWRVPRVATSVRNSSTSQQARQKDVDIIRRLRRQERITAATLDADLDDFLHRFDTFHTSAAASEKAVATALRQKKYISTERLSYTHNMAKFGQEIIDHFNDLKKHIKDLDEEPYPNWQPGDSDVVLRQLDDPNLKPEDLESELKTRHKDVKRLLDQADEHYQALAKARTALREKGVAAAEAVADDFVNSRSSDYNFANINVPLDPVDLDTIDEDPAFLLTHLRRKTP